tara:strand:+ start:15789 stop:16172 length:384 start_codon:yes stop_codon:yes gene_type:complete
MSVNKPADKKLYDSVKAQVMRAIPKHSAYRSGRIVMLYKQKFKAKYGNKRSPYTGKKPLNKGLDRWFKEDWRSQKGKKGYDTKGDIFRPTKRITKDTPTTMSELSRGQIKRAMKEKKSTGRVKKYKK